MQPTAFNFSLFGRSFLKNSLNYIAPHFENYFKNSNLIQIMVGTCYGMRGRDMGHAHLLRYQCETSDLNLKDAAQVHVIRLLILPTGTIYSTTTI